MTPVRIPKAGERYMMCCHVEGSALIGFPRAHILCVTNPGGGTAVRNDGRELDIRWYILCDACDVVFETDAEVTLEGRDGVWPEGAVIDFDDRSMN